MKHTLYIVLLMLILLVPTIAADHDDFQQEGNGIVVNYKDDIFLMRGRAYNFHIHAFNDTAGGAILTDTTTTCTLHLYNSTGHHTLRQALAYDGAGDFGVELSRENFTLLDNYVYTVGCSNGDGWGFISGSFVITESGLVEEKMDTTAGIATIIFLLVITTGLFILGFAHFSDSGILDFILKRSSIMFGMLMLMFDSAIIAQIVDKANLGLETEMMRLMVVFGWATWIALIILFVGTIFNIIFMAKEQIEGKRMGGDGVG